MAENVQAIMDGMVPALRDLMDDGIFSETEIRAIVSRRRESEYLLRRRVARKADFLRYAEAEMNLERLRQLRKKQNKRNRKNEEDKKQTETRKKRSNIGHGSIIRNIHFIFTRATRKWRNDVSLYLAHADYAKKSKSFRILGRIYAEALQVHPKRCDLWIEAASHEFFGYLDADDNSSYGGSIENARILMQRGIRVNPTSQQLYLQYFSLEWHYAQKIRGRKEILQLTNEDNKSPLVPLDPDQINNQSNPNDPNSALYRGAVPLVIFKMAIQKIPDDVHFRLQFLSLCDLFPQTTEVKQFIMKSIEQDFSHLPDAWIVRAIFIADNYGKYSQNNKDVGFINTSSERNSDNQNIDSKNNNDNDESKIQQQIQQEEDYDEIADIVKILDEALMRLPTIEMYLKSIEFIQSRADSSNDEKYVEYLNQLFLKAKRTNISSPELKSKWANFLLGKKEIIQAEKLLRLATTASKNEKSNVNLWIQYADLIHKMDITGLLPKLRKEYQNEDTLRQPPTNALEVIRAASNKFPIYDASYLTIQIVLFKHLLINYGSNQRYEKEISSLFTKILLVSHKESHDNNASSSSNGQDQISSLCLKYLQYATTSGGVLAARRVYEAVLFNSNFITRAYPNESKFGEDIALFFNACISLEKSYLDHNDSALKGSKQSKSNKRQKNSNEIVRLDKKSQGGNIHRLQRIYECAIAFYKRGNDGDMLHNFRQKRYEDLGVV